LFLDEIGDLPLEIQPKLLRLLQEKEYERVGETKTRKANVRVIAATNRNLEQGVADGRFREDLFYRLNVISLRLPSLRERPADLQRFATNYLGFFARQCGKEVSGFSHAAAQAIQNYRWPGNLRELRNVVERAAILASGKQIEAGDLPENLNRAPDAGEPTTPQVGARISLEELENQHLRQVIAKTSSMEEAAQILGIDPATLYRKRKKLGL
jgi:NtrC-family two-component system response regulator AlgB